MSHSVTPLRAVRVRRETEHAAWCAQHVDLGDYDQLCSAEQGTLAPAAAERCVARISTVQISEARGREGAWHPGLARVAVAFVDEDGAVELDLAPAEARRLAAMLLDSADLLHPHTTDKADR